MKVTFLGTGTSQGIPVIGCNCPVCTSSNPKDKRLRVSIMVEWDDLRLVVDVGPDFRQQMLAVGGHEIDAILVTHEHNDHVAGLDDVRPFNFRYDKDMPIYALPRVIKNLEKRFDYVFSSNPYPGAPRIIPYSVEANQDILIKNKHIQSIEILHGKLPILGFRFGAFAYLTDVKTIPSASFEQLKKLDVLTISALHRNEHHSHLTLEESLAFAKKIGAKKTYLTHFSHLMGRHTDLLEELPPNIRPAYDGLEILL